MLCVRSTIRNTSGATSFWHTCVRGGRLRVMSSQATSMEEPTNLRLSHGVVHERPRIESAVFLVCDIQERFRDLIVGFPSVVSTAKTLAATAAALSIPLVVTEQYPKVFKPTVHELGPWLRSEQNPNGAPVFAKLKFSMMVPEVRAHVASVREHGVTDYILFGIEAHVCVQHTALDLLREGANVHIVVDGVSSQRRGDRAVALRLLQSSGAILTTTESIIFSLLGSAEHPAFKAVQPIVIAHNKGRSELLEMSA